MNRKQIILATSLAMFAGAGLAILDFHYGITAGKSPTATTLTATQPAAGSQQAAGSLTGPIDTYEKFCVAHWPDLERLICWFGRDPMRAARFLELLDQAEIPAAQDGADRLLKLGITAGRLAAIGVPPVAAPEPKLMYAAIGRTHGDRDCGFVIPTDGTRVIDPRFGEPAELALLYDGFVTLLTYRQAFAMPNHPDRTITRIVERNQILYSAHWPTSQFKITCRGPGSPILNVKFSPGDVTGDGYVSTADMVKVRDRIGAEVTADTCRFDVNCDGAIDERDLTAIRSVMSKVY